MKEIVGRALRSAGLPTRLEPLGLCRGTNNKRPDGETLVPWQSGQPLAFDVTCIDSFAPSRQHCQPGVALVKKEAEKRAKYAWRWPFNEWHSMYYVYCQIFRDLAC